MKKALIFSVAAILTMSAQAQKKPVPQPNSISIAINGILDSRVKYFAYNEDVVYTLPITVGMHTHVVMAPDERLTEKPKMGETIQWRVSGNEKNLYIKTLQPGVKTSLTLVTDRRSYQFELVATEDPAKRVQKVYFTYPDDDEKMEIAALEGSKALKAAADAETKRREDLKTSPAVDRAALSFYSVTGDAPFKPRVVFDDGTFTHIYFEKVQDLPAVFMVESNGKLSPINYTIKDSQILVERVAEKFMLKLGKDELLITKAK